MTHEVRKSLLGFAALAACAVAAPAAAQTMDANSASFNGGWGRYPGQENHAIDVSTRYKNQDTMAYQRHAHIAAGGQWIIIAATSELDRRDACDQAIERVLTTLELRDM